MPVRIGNRVFAPGLAGTLATAALLPCFVALGFWQLGRAEEKRALLDAYAAGATRVVDIDSVGTVGALARYQRVRVRGRYEPDQQVLLDNMPSRQGRPGYQVLTPLVLAGGGRLLVNRGWVPLGATRVTLPDVAVGAEPRTLTGRLDELPQPGLRLDDPQSVTDVSWPAVLHYPTVEQLRDRYGPDLVSSVLLLDPTASDGYERAWETRFGYGPERHVGYAVQWFALAAALVLIFAAVNLKGTANANV